MVVALGSAPPDLAPDVATTFAALAGSALFRCGVHRGWLMFYDRKSDGPPS